MPLSRRTIHWYGLKIKNNDESFPKHHCYSIIIQMPFQKCNRKNKKMQDYFSALAKKDKTGRANMLTLYKLTSAKAQFLLATKSL